MTIGFLKTLRLKSAPLMTKKRANSGAVHLSALAMISPERGQRLQSIVPSIIHTNRDENDTVIGPILKLMDEIAMVTKTKEIVSDSLLEFEKKSSSSFVKITPISEPSSRDATISISGFTRIATRLTVLVIRV